MSLIKTSLVSSIAVGIRIVSLLTINKVLAVTIGPGGFAMIGQFQNVLTGLVALGSMGIGTGITKYIAEYSNEHEKQKRVWATAVVIAIFASTTIAIGLITYSEEITLKLFNNLDYKIIIIVVALCLPILSLNSNLLALINGKKNVNIFTIANISNSIILLICISTASLSSNVNYVILALVIGQAIGLIVNVSISNKILTNFGKFISYKYDGEFSKKLFKYSIISLITTVLGPLSQIAIRNILIEEINIDYAGYWDAMLRISGILIMIVSTPIAVYYLPRISELNNNDEIKKEIYKTYKLLVPVVVGLCMLFYILRDYIVDIMFSENFSSMNVLFKYQLLGDVFRMIAWVLSFYMVAKALIYKFVITEILFTSSYVFLSWILIKNIGFEGVSISYGINNLLYLIFLTIIISRELKINLINKFFKY